jgi:hypothetical protein
MAGLVGVLQLALSVVNSNLQAARWTSAIGSLSSLAFSLMLFVLAAAAAHVSEGEAGSCFQGLGTKSMGCVSAKARAANRA